MATIEEIDAAMQHLMDTVLDDHTVAMTEAWATAWEDVRDELEAAVLGQVAAGNVGDAVPLDPRHMERALSALTQALGECVVASDDRLQEALDRVVNLGAEGHAAMIGVQRPAGQVPLLASPESIAAIINRSREQITATHWPITEDATAAMRRRLVRGVVVGDNPRLVAQQIISDVHGAFNGGLSRATNVARTEMLDAMRAGQQATEDINVGLLAGWVWHAHLGPRTCRSCLGMHGTVHPLSEPGPLDHQSGRCSRLPKTKSWAELGFPGVPDTQVPIGDAEAWLRAQPVEDQQAILTRRGWDAWRRGDYPPSAWSRLRTTPEWRDSYAPSNPPGGNP